MTTSVQTESYGASRRALGICYVGTIVTISVVALCTRLAERVFGSIDQSYFHWFRNILLFTIAYELISVPFDVTGFFIERKFHKNLQSLFGYLCELGKSSIKHGVLLLSSAFLFAYAAENAGLPGVVISTIALGTFYTWKQAEIARFLSNLTFSEPSQEMRGTFVKNRSNTVALVMGNSADKGFTGGVVGLPRGESLVIPEGWLTDLSEQELWAEITRRNAAIESGSRTRGIIGALFFVVCGVTAAASLTAFCYKLPLQSSAGIIDVSLISTLWSFAGLLILPSLNQKGVIEADNMALAKGVRQDLLARTINKIDATMENEAVRSNAVQFVFHPIPTPGRRVMAWNVETGPGAWHIARYAVWLSLAGLGLLGRAVHCNAGRPDLWSMLPAD